MPTAMSLFRFYVASALLAGSSSAVMKGTHYPFGSDNIDYGGTIRYLTFSLFSIQFTLTEINCPREACQF